jgi:HEAT repeat protein
MRSLGQLNVADAALNVAACLSHPEPNLRKEAAAALGQFARPETLPFVVAAVSDPDSDVRKNVRWALFRIDEQRAKSPSS